MGQSESILTLDTKKILGLADFEKIFNSDDLNVNNKINKGAYGIVYSVQKKKRSLEYAVKEITEYLAGEKEK